MRITRVFLTIVVAMLPVAALVQGQQSSGSTKATTTTTTEVTPSLRDQIDAAETPEEKIRLQLQLVDEFAKAGKKSDAIAELHRVVAIDVFDPQSFYNAGNSLARLGDTDEAINAYHKAIDQRKGNYSRAHNNLGVVLLRVGRWDEAYNSFLAALKIENFHYPEASYNLGRLYAIRGEKDLAVREWRRVLTQNPNHTAARDALAQIGNQGRVEVEVASAKAPPAPPQVRNRNKEAEKPVFTAKVSEKPVAVKPKSESKPQVLIVDSATYEFLQRARTSAERGKTMDAIDSYKRVISRQGGYFPPANLELSYQQFLTKRYDEALSNLLLVANRDGANFPISYFHLGRLYEMKGDLKQAESAFSLAAAAYKTTNSQFLLDLSRVREKQGDYKGALDAMQQYVDNMNQQGQAVSWSDERLAALRQKANTPK